MTTAVETASAGRSAGSCQSDFQNQYVSFLIGKQLLGVPVSAVQEVLNPQTIARTPKAKPEIAGLLNLRGQIVTAVDLRKRLGLAPLTGDRQSMNVVVRHKGESYSLLVDEVGDVIDVKTESLESPPQTLDAHWKSLLSGVFQLEKDLFIILDINALLTF